jgi:aspartyl-tRNA(Asn)/glutamyl-tRNA(Gln) amidotransferase subunit C
MADITRDDVLKLARLSKIKLDKDEIKKLTLELNEIVKYVEQISAVDVSELEPTDQVTGLTNVMREDKPIDYQAAPADLLKNTPAVQDNQIKVKRVLQ